MQVKAANRGPEIYPTVLALYLDGTPLRYRIRAPDFVNLGVLPHIAQGAMFADVVALIGTIDIVLGSVDW